MGLFEFTSTLATFCLCTFMTCAQRLTCFRFLLFDGKAGAGTDGNTGGGNGGDIGCNTGGGDGGDTGGSKDGGSPITSSTFLSGSGGNGVASGSNMGGGDGRG